jgi:acetate kinase
VDAIGNVLVVNAGSSSLKLALLDPADRVLVATTVERWDGGTDTGGTGDFLGGLPAAPSAVGHRVVHGGADFTSPVVLDDDVVGALEGLTPLAPLHQPRSLRAVAAMRSALPDVPHVACFDTAFHATMPTFAVTYALPRAWRERWPLRRFGFHGLSHAYASRRVVELVGPVSRVVTCHLGAGASLCAVLDGRSVDTTMGFTPLDGLVMATRSGTVDPGLLLWLQQHGGLSADEVRDGLEQESGLSGLAGSGDLRDVLAAREQGDSAAELAFDVYVHRLAQAIAAMAASLGGLDVLVFTGGVGEHSPDVRLAASEKLAWLGVQIDPEVSVEGDADITAAGAGVRTVVVTAREDVEIARQSRRAVSA